MNKFALTAALGAACLGLAACDDRRDGNAAGTMAEDNSISSMDDAGGNSMASGAGAASGSAFPKGARIVEENGVTYRVDASGTRVKLGSNESRIVVENGVRYRVDPDGTRVKINTEGVSMDIDTPDIDVPDVDIGINEKGNPDVDVKDRSDGDTSVNSNR